MRLAHDATNVTPPIDRIITALSGGINWREKRPDYNPDRPTMTALTLNAAANVACASTWISQARIHLRKRWPGLTIICNRHEKPNWYRIMTVVDADDLAAQMKHSKRIVLCANIGQTMQERIGTAPVAEKPKPHASSLEAFPGRPLEIRPERETRGPSPRVCPPSSGQCPAPAPLLQACFSPAFYKRHFTDALMRMRSACRHYGPAEGNLYECDKCGKVIT